VPDLEARVLAELSAVAFAIAYKRWLATTSSDNFAGILRDAIDEVRCVISTT
jgi:hypothetical protein